MLAERGRVNKGRRKRYQVKDLFEQYSRYSSEAAILENKLCQPGAKREPARQARLNDLKQRLMPALQKKIESF